MHYIYALSKTKHSLMLACVKYPFMLAYSLIANISSLYKESSTYWFIWIPHALYIMTHYRIETHPKPQHIPLVGCLKAGYCFKILKDPIPYHQISQIQLLLFQSTLSIIYEINVSLRQCCQLSGYQSGHIVIWAKILSIVFKTSLLTIE
jgi:hypothetical protein